MFTTWTVVHVYFPLVPFGLGGLLRLVTSLDLSWNTFSASDLAICLGLLSLLVSQSLLKAEPHILDDEDKREEAKKQVYLFLFYAVVLIVFFAVTTVFDSLVTDRGYRELNISLRIFQGLTFATLLFMLWVTRRTQQSFRLSGALW